MGQRELLLTLGAIALFSISSLSINQLAVKNSEAVYGQQATFFATKVAQRFIEEAKVKAFDETTIIGTPSLLPDGFTTTLGPGGGETYPNFDDVDDYHGLDITRSTNMGDMRVGIAVIYVQDSDLATAALTPTFYKKMTVVVQSAYLPHSVRAEHIFTFQKNR